MVIIKSKVTAVVVQGESGARSVASRFGLAFTKPDPPSGQIVLEKT